MSDKAIEIVKQWIVKGDHDLGTAKVPIYISPNILTL